MLYQCIIVMVQRHKEVAMIEIKNVSKKYKEFYAVKDVSLKIERGKIYGLVGKNGAGKSTLFKLILGLSKGDSGTIHINGSTDSKTLNKERAKVGFYMGPSFFGNMNAVQNLKYVQKLRNSFDNNEIERVLKIVDLANESKPYKSYSMGMKQRLGIANAIMGNPEIILLDEPINGLDPQGIHDIRRIILSLSRDQGKTVIVSSHILSELELVADRFGIIDHGVILKDFNKDHDEDEEYYIELVTSNNTKALEVLKDYEVVEDAMVLKVYTKQIPSEILMSLLEHKIDILKLNPRKQNLEDQYFALTGGTQ